MRGLGTYVRSIMAAGLLAAGVVAAQTPQQNCASTAKDAQGNPVVPAGCAAAAPPANATQRFPFPGEDSASKPMPGESPDASQPAAPGDQGAKPASPNNAGGLQDAGSSGSSSSPDAGSSSSSSSSSANDADKPTGDDSPLGDPAPAPKRGRKKLPAVPRQSPSERESEDLQVAGYYMNDGNFRAAYLRAKDAVDLSETDADAQFALAEAARKLGKLDEAVQHYKRCLELDPLPKPKKESQKALKEMTGS